MCGLTVAGCGLGSESGSGQEACYEQEAWHEEAACCERAGAVGPKTGGVVVAIGGGVPPRTSLRHFVASLAICTIVVAAAITPQPATAFPEQFREALTAAPVLPEGTHAYLFSSFDRTGGNDDGNRLYAYSRFDRSTRVFTLHEAGGPGVITRFWMTGWRNPEPLSWIVDDDVSMEVPVLSHFSGTTEPFLAPYVADEHRVSGGFVSFVPVPYRDQFALKTNSVPRYFQMGYRRFSSVVAREYWHARPAVSVPAEQGSPSVTLSGGPTTVTPGGDSTPLRQEFTGWVRALHIHLAGVSGGPTTAGVDQTGNTDANGSTNIGTDLDEVNLVVTVDGETAIHAPLSFVAAGSRTGEAVDAVPVTVSRDQASRLDGSMETPASGSSDAPIHIAFRFPIPVAQSFSVRLENRADLRQDRKDRQSREVRVQVVAELAPDMSVPGKLTAGQIGRLRTTYKDIPVAPGGSDALLLDTTGRGVLVGVVLETRGRTQDELRILEGDERIFVDGARSPQLHGTGTEDFFNGGWYYKFGPFSRPFSGHVHRSREHDMDIVTQYRYLLLDPLPYYQSLRFHQEYGRTNDVEGRLRSFLVYYETQVDRMVQTELVVTSGLVSTEQVKVPVWGHPGAGETPATFGTTREPIVLSATVPDGTQHLLLRRGTDASVVPQRALVRVTASEGQKPGASGLPDRNVEHTGAKTTTPIDGSRLWLVSGHSRDPMYREVEIPLAISAAASDAHGTPDAEGTPDGNTDVGDNPGGAPGQVPSERGEPAPSQQLTITITPETDFVFSDWSLFYLPPTQGGLHDD